MIFSGNIFTLVCWQLKTVMRFEELGPISLSNELLTLFNCSLFRCDCSFDIASNGMASNTYLSMTI